MEVAQEAQGHRHRLRTLRLLAVVGLVSLTSCEAMQQNWERNAAFWNSPQGQMVTLQAFQQQQALNQQSYQFEQSLLLQQAQMYAESARSMQPVRVEHSGSVDVR